MVRFVAVEASTSLPRDEAVAKALALLGAEGGFVTGTHELGGLALTLSFELPRTAAVTLGARARAAGIRIGEPDDEALVRAADATDPIVGSLLLRFYANEPDRRVEIPKVPG